MKSDAERSSPLSVLMDLIHGYGNVVRFRTEFGTFFLVNDPSLVHEILCRSDFIRNRLLKMVLGNGVLSSNGAHWQQQRRRMLPVFRPQMIKTLVDLFRRVTEDRIASWSHESSTWSTRDVVPEMFRIALSNVAQGLLGTTFDDQFLDATDCVMREISAIQNATMFGFPLVRQPHSYRDYQAALAVMEEGVAASLESNRQGASPQARLVNLLRSNGSQPGNSPLSPQQIRDEVLTMITAGHETTAVSLCWAAYGIASHQHVAERLYAEVDTLLEGRPVQSADLPRLQYTRMVIDETLRLYPPVWVVARTVARDVELGGYHIPAGSGVLVSPFAIQRSPEAWPDPERFDPERFRPGAKPPAANSYLPFLAGRHLCLGKHFALAEMLVVLVTLAQRFRFHLPQETTAEIEPLVSLRIRGGLPLGLRSRRAEINSCS